MNKRNEIKKKAYAENGVGKRLKWAINLCKESLHEISRTTGMPYSTISHMINGGRYGYYEEIYLVTQHLNREYQTKFNETPQYYQGEPVDKITFTWLLLGADPDREELKEKLKNQKEEQDRREMEYVERIFELESIKNQ